MHDNKGDNFSDFILPLEKRESNKILPFHKGENYEALPFF